jgi:hypothetical protein
METKRKYFLLLIPVLLGCILLLALDHKTVYSEFSDPTGRYVAKISYRSFYSLIPTAPGSSSDKPGFVEIFNQQGQSMGRIPLPVLQMVQIDWEPSGASIPAVAEWNFLDGSCYYWDQLQSRKIFVKGIQGSD